MSVEQHQQHRRDISTPSLIATFPLRGAYPGLAVGVVLQTQAQACIAADTPRIDTSTPNDVNWTSSLHWVNEDNVDFMSIFDCDAYGDFLDLDTDRALALYAQCMSGVHFALFENIWKESGQRPRDRKFRRLPLPGKMVMEHEDDEVWESSALEADSSQTSKERVEGSVGSLQRERALTVTPPQMPGARRGGVYRFLKMSRRADAES